MCVEKQEPYSAGENEPRLCTGTRTNTFHLFLLTRENKQLFASRTAPSIQQSNESSAGKTASSLSH